MLKPFVEDKVEVYNTHPESKDPRVKERQEKIKALLKAHVGSIGGHTPAPKTIPSFAVDNAWLAKAIGMVGVNLKTAKARWWNRVVWEGAAIQDIAHPDSTPFVLLFMQVGRGRRNRYVVSDGNVWCDVRGKVMRGGRTSRRQWCRQDGPWTLIESEQARPLNKSAQAVINAAMRAFMAVEFKCEV